MQLRSHNRDRTDSSKGLPKRSCSAQSAGNSGAIRGHQQGKPCWCCGEKCPGIASTAGIGRVCSLWSPL